MTVPKSFLAFLAWAAEAIARDPQWKELTGGDSIRVIKQCDLLREGARFLEKLLREPANCLNGSAHLIGMPAGFTAEIAFRGQSGEFEGVFGELAGPPVMPLSMRTVTQNWRCTVQ